MADKEVKPREAFDVSKSRTVRLDINRRYPFKETVVVVEGSYRCEVWAMVDEYTQTFRRVPATEPAGEGWLNDYFRSFTVTTAYRFLRIRVTKGDPENITGHFYLGERDMAKTVGTLAEISRRIVNQVPQEHLRAMVPDDVLVYIRLGDLRKLRAAMIGILESSEGG